MGPPSSTMPEFRSARIPFCLLFLLTSTILVATLISFPLINRYSRRGLLIASVLGMAFSHLLMATLLAVHAPALTVLIPMMLGAGTFTVGLAPLSWIIVSEIFPNRVRSPALAVVCVFLFGSSVHHGAAVPDGDGLAQADDGYACPHVRGVRGDLRVLRRLYMEGDARNEGSQPRGDRRVLASPSGRARANYPQVDISR